MRLGVGGDLGEPRAGNHDASGRGGVSVESVEAGSVLGVGDGEVVGVDDKELGIAGIA
jgi:Tfp pilus assembly protein PilP